MSTDEKAVAALVGLICGPIAIISGGFVLAKMWGWFVVPEFAAPVLTLNTAIGLDLIFSFLNVKRCDWWPFEKDEDKEITAELTKAIYPCLIPWLVLLAGWIVLAFK